MSPQKMQAVSPSAQWSSTMFSHVSSYHLILCGLLARSTRSAGSPDPFLLLRPVFPSLCSYSGRKFIFRPHGQTALSKISQSVPGCDNYMPRFSPAYCLTNLNFPQIAKPFILGMRLGSRSTCTELRSEALLKLTITAPRIYSSAFTSFHKI
jgi:hypothetical protein